MTFFRVFINLFRFDRANWKAVALCMLAASVFWLFNAFNKEHSTNIRFPLLIDFDQQKFAALTVPPQVITINVQGKGWDLFRKHFGMNVPHITLPVKDPVKTKRIVGSSLQPLLAPQLGGLQINFIVTDTLHLSVEKKDSHRYKLTLNGENINYKEGYGRTSPIVILPDSVTLEGPESVLHQLSDSIELNISKDNVSEDFREEVEVIFPHGEMTHRNPPVVQVMFEVAQVVVIRKVLSLRNDALLKMNNLPDSVVAHFRVPVRHKIDFESNARKLLATLSNDVIDKSGVFQPTIKFIPSYAELIQIDSVVIKGGRGIPK